MRRLKDKERQFVKYFHDAATRNTLQLLLCFCYLPYNVIPQVFDHISQKSPSNLSGLIIYMDKNWINGNFWKPERWSVFKRDLRTNNEAEGTHLRWQKRGEVSNLTLYRCIDFLYREAERLSLVEKLLTVTSGTR